MEYITKRIDWESDAGVKMFRHDIFKGILKVGMIYPPNMDAPKDWSKYGKLLVMIEKTHKSRYVQKFETALNHIKRQTKNVYSLIPKSEIKKYIKNRRPSSKKIHVSKRSHGKWVIKREGATKTSPGMLPKIQAIEEAKNKMKKQKGGAVIVHNDGGKIEKYIKYDKRG